MLKKLFKILMILLIFAATALFGLFIFMEPIISGSSFVLQQSLSRALAADVRIGKIGLVWQPMPELEIKQLRISSHDPCYEPFQLEKALVRFNPIGLLYKQIIISTLTLDRPDIDTEKTAKGWQFAKIRNRSCTEKSAAAGGSSSAQKESRKRDKADAEQDAYQIVINQIQINEGSINLGNPDQYLDLRGLNLKLKLPAVALTPRMLEKMQKFQADIRIKSLRCRQPDILAESVHLTIDEAHLSAAASKISGSLALKKLDIKDGSDRYQSAAVQTPFELKTTADRVFNIKASAKVAGFGYNNGDVEIKEVNADLRDIEGNISKQGDVSFSVDLLGQSIILHHSEIDIHRVTEVRSPLKILVPAAGGYKVMGPVTVHNADIHTADRDLQAVSGKVDMLISGPLKRFTSEDLIFELNRKKVNAQTAFSMTKDSYDIADTDIMVGKGKISASIQLLRDGSRHFSGQAAISQFNIQDLLSLLLPEKSEHYQGLIQVPQLTFQARTDRWRETLTAQGSLKLEQAGLKSKSVREKIMQAVKQVPPFSSIGSVPDDDQLNEEISANFDVAEQKVRIQNTKVKRAKYTVEGSGTISFDKQVKFKADVIFLRETLSALGLGIKPLKKAIRSVAKIKIPIVIDGQIPDISVRTDKEEMLKRGSGYSLIEKTIKSISKPFSG